MSDSRRQPQQTVLFDLDLDLDLTAEPAAAGEEGVAGSALKAEPALEAELEAEAASPAAAEELASIRSRLAAAAVDLGCHFVVALVGAVGMALLGVRPQPQTLPGLALLLVVFSLVFVVVPLAFWGKTAGMAAAGLVCRAAGAQPLTFGEAARRWLGSLLTVLAFGLPALPVLAGRRSLADWLSGTVLIRD